MQTKNLMRREFCLNEGFDLNKQQTHRLSKSIGMIEKNHENPQSGVVDHGRLE
jgi:hypothetical protein